ncbi:MAG: ferrous iron transporter B [Clostridiales bacterium]|nr:ferrous iron transporter B [Clostridiales bacterium]
MLQRLDKALIRPVTGIPIIICIMIGVFLFVGRFVAQTVVDFTQSYLFGELYYNFIMSYATTFFDLDSFLGCLLFGEYGLLTMIPIYLFGLLLPLVFSFYFVMTLLQDSGIFHRISVLADKVFRAIGLSGGAIVPIVLGFGCVTAALISVGTLKSKREQLIASVLLCFSFPCSAQLTIVLAISSFLEIKYILLYFFTILTIFLLSGFILNFLIPGKSSKYIPRLPALVMPSITNVFNKTIRESKDFIIDATPSFIIGGALMAILHYTNSFVKIYKLFSPLTSGLLKLPDQATDLFLLSIIKKDVAAASLYSIVSQNIMTDFQITIALIVMTLFVPCFASAMVLFKDRGPLVAIIIYIACFLVGFTTGGLINIIFS